MNPDQYEAHLWAMMYRTMGFMLMTYVPLQVAAILMMKRLPWRIAAALPLIPMLPVIYAGMDRDAYRDGSLYGLVFYFPYAPVMVYLAILIFAGLASRAAKTTAIESEQTNDSGGTRLPVILLTLAVLFGLGVLVCFLVLVPR
ncbi:MAG: hypothetical protein O3C40_13170 [Planctomycetota bacterium]|nr:hypothetical protein [Planctomycetota bacterium]